MWHFISDQISQQINKDFICDDIRAGNSGDTHKNYRISDGKLRFFVKVNHADKLANFEAEAQGLEHIQQAQMFKVPEVICLGSIEESSYLVLEYISLSQGDESAWFDFGDRLANLHQSQTQKMYGWQDDNFIGLTPQPNRWSRNWAQFFAEQRIGFMLQLLAEKGHQLANIDQVVDSVEKLLAGHNPTASMLHGDLWMGNTGFSKNKAVMFDPAFHYGDRETDLAMSELFNKFPAAFYQGYEGRWPVSEHYLYRKTIYQLYHILNHAILFEGQYIQNAKGILKNLQL